MASQGTIQEYAKAINSSWHKTTDSVLETARLCAEANKKFGAEPRKELIKELDFSSAAFSKLSFNQPPEAYREFSQSYLYRRTTRAPPSEQKCSQNGIFFPSPFNDLSRAESGDACSSLSSGCQALQYTDEGAMELPHENPEEPDVRCHEQGITEPCSRSTGEARPSS
jgi:hypothetical protein